MVVTDEMIVSGSETESLMTICVVIMWFSPSSVRRCVSWILLTPSSARISSVMRLMRSGSGFACKKILTERTRFGMVCEIMKREIQTASSESTRYRPVK